ncbi:hypothetical protein NIES1031_02520 [Chroogloeocystis siderophila 5.2 s.c.1]|uniref:Uncharacterized protein n=1 Tax=Chroogloeocystis siderophila 5.2 s.c.1 TaxID=247279 RepID=A0A1U7HZA1_9CHRO|nr:hypothetical protein NIES1031_02520 [Chroogloeocystis siderophila 5.2 s.c.1]
MEQSLLEKVTALARQTGQSPEKIITEAVKQYIEAATIQQTTEPDPLIGLFSSSSDLATQADDILQQEITQNSGWTWKEPS